MSCCLQDLFSKVFLISLLVVLLLPFKTAAADFTLCPNITLKEGKLRLSNNEKVLVCGTTKSDDGWVDVPVPQAQYQLKILFQNIGYLNPRFERNGNQLWVWSGPQTEIKGLKADGAGEHLDTTRKRKIVGYPLMPSKLDEVNKWADFVLRSHGFACPVLNVSAEAWNGQVTVETNPGQKQGISKMDVTGLDGLDPAALERYQPFQLGEAYDVRKTQIMAYRMLGDGLFQSVYFVTNCKPDDKVELELNTTVGKPRLLRFDIGASTEELPFAEVTLKNTRLDDQASSLTSVLHGSPIRQSGKVTSELYWIRGWNRTYLGPRFEVTRQDERDVLDLQARLGGDLGRKWDEHDFRVLARVGPTLNYVKTYRGIGPGDKSYFNWEGSVTLMSHVYEIGQRDQYDGWTAAFFYTGQRKGLGSELNVDRYEVRYKTLWNLGDYMPPLFVLGTRLEGIAVDSDRIDQGDIREQLPPEYRIKYGGDSDLRGFARKDLNNGGLGYLTSIYAGFELRLIEQLPWRLEPFLLWDAARLGSKRLTLGAPWFSSEGAGIRWNSPFGALRASAARGRIFNGDETTTGYRQEWIYFLSFGQEF